MKTKKTKRKKPTLTELTDISKDKIGSFFLDSGAFSMKTKATEYARKNSCSRWDFYDTEEFWSYCEGYAKFLKENSWALDYYANVDAIGSPELTWRNQQYFEKKHNLRPVPVVHCRSELKWVQKYIDEGHTLIGIGGGLQSWDHDWLDRLFTLVCPPPNRLPAVRLHGFAVTWYNLMVRYPFWSVDSASWVKSGGFGRVLVPHKRQGKFTFGEKPYTVVMSAQSPDIKNGKARHLKAFSKGARQVILDWLEQIQIPLGSVNEKNEMIEWGVTSHHAARKIANLKFFQVLCDWLPPWPWAYTPSVKRIQFSW